MRKWLVFSLLLLLSACAAPQPRNVSFMVSGSPEELKAYQTLVAAFEKSITASLIIAGMAMHTPGSEPWAELSRTNSKTN